MRMMIGAGGLSLPGGAIVGELDELGVDEVLGDGLLLEALGEELLGPGDELSDVEPEVEGVGELLLPDGDSVLPLLDGEGEPVAPVELGELEGDGDSLWADGVLAGVVPFVDAQMMMCEMALSLPWPPGSKMPLAFTSAHTTSPGAGLEKTVFGCNVESLDVTLPALTITFL